jgi:hypothetical protein
MWKIAKSKKIITVYNSSGFIERIVKKSYNKESKIGGEYSMCEGEEERIQGFSGKT